MEECYIIKKLLFIKKIYTKALNGSPNDDLNSVFAIFADVISKKEFRSQQELSDFLGCNKAHTSRTLLKMQLRGLIKPISKTISLTDKGKQFAESVKKETRALKEQLIAGIDERDLQTFNKVLDQIVANGNLIDKK